MKFVLIPDSFKGSLSSTEVCDVMENAIKSVFKKIDPSLKIISLPVADGGEGTVDAFLKAVGGEKIFVEANNPFFQKISAFYGKLNDGTVVIEMAAAAGLPLVGTRKEVEKTTTYGVGELMNHAIEHGAKKIILGLGGSATNDGGCGAAAALGAKFFDSEEKIFIPTGENLKNISRIEIQNLQKKLNGVDVTVMCDITNPLCGELGAAAVFGPQKGATPAQVKFLDEGLAHLAKIILRDVGIDVLNLSGAGAAGGMGAGAAAFFNGKLMKGIEIVLDTVKFSEKIHDADLIFTGEGKFDRQSLMGKVADGVASRAKKIRVPVVVIAGSIGDDIDDETMQAAGISAAFSICPEPCTLADAQKQSKEFLFRAMKNILRLWNL